jgi:thiol:disulfide interchange protein
MSGFFRLADTLLELGDCMAEFVNSYSAIILGFFIFMAAAMLAWGQRRNMLGLAVIVIVLFVLIAGWSTARTGPSDVANLAELDAAITAGTPVVLELYSDTCALCLYSKRSVDEIEADLEGRAIVLRVSVDEQIGGDVSRRYGLHALPTFIVFSEDGREVYRQAGSPDTERIKHEVLSPS